jgi:hypothetical protein
MKTIITIGTGYSGSSAIYDFLKKTKKFVDPFPDREFSLTYDPGGLVDLEDKVLKARSINQVNFVIKQFQKNLYYYTNADNAVKPGKNFPNKKKLKYLFGEYINKITEFKYIGESTFMKHQGNFFSYLKSKFYEKLNLKRKKEIISLVDHKEFKEETQKFLNKLFFEDEKTSNIILDQGGSIIDIFNSTKFYKNPRIILIYRDPRDIFSEFKQKSAYSYPKEDVKIFCKWYEKLIKSIDDQNFQNINILKINFEDFVLNHENTVKKISEFILEDIHAPIDNFDLERPKSNLLKFKNLLNDLEVSTIEKLLGKYLYLKKNEH